MFWAGNFVLGRAMHAAIPPIGLAFWRWSLAVLLVLPFVWRPMRKQWPVLRAAFGRMTVLALLGVTGFNTLVYVGLQTTTATNSVLIQSTMPVQILLLNALIFRAPMKAREIFSILLSLAGIVLIIGAGDPRQLLQGGWNTGDLWVLAAALTWAAYSVLLRWRPPTLRAPAFLGFTLLVGWVALVPFYIAEAMFSRPMVWDVPVLLTVAYVAVFPSALAYLFWNRGVEAIGANSAGHFIHLMPVFGTLMAVVFLGESLQGYHAAGAVLVAGAIWVATRASKQPAE